PNIYHQAADKPEDSSTFVRRYLKRRKRNLDMRDKRLPIALAYAHAFVRGFMSRPTYMSGPPAAEHRKLISSCLSRRTPSSPRCCQNRPSCASALSRANRSSTTETIASYPPRR